MSEMKKAQGYALGPWKVVENRHHPWTNALGIVDPDGRCVAHTTRGFDFYSEPHLMAGEMAPSWHNGHLIAAAPELLDALRSLVNYLRESERWPVKAEQMAYLQSAEAAIRKAEHVTELTHEDSDDPATA